MYPIADTDTPQRTDTTPPGFTDEALRRDLTGPGSYGRAMAAQLLAVPEEYRHWVESHVWVEYESGSLADPEQVRAARIAQLAATGVTIRPLADVLNPHIAANLAQLDGTTASSVALLTGMTRAELDELGGVPEETTRKDQTR